MHTNLLKIKASLTMNSIFLCDLSHTSQRISSEYIPYAIGCIKSYFHANAKTEADIFLYKYPEKFSTEYFTHTPSLVGFSNYMWNTDLNYLFAKAIKEVNPNTLIVFGGRNYPLETHRQKKWFQDRPAVDAYIIGEGEQPFLEVADIWLETHSIEEIKRAEINGVHSYYDGELNKTGPIRKDGYDQEPRIQDLTQTPSPYLMGYLDDFIQDPQLAPLMETNRGCPFQCTFCVDGVGSRNKIFKSNLERSEAELVYIAERYKGKYLQLADVNFGMYAEDIEFSKAIARTKEKYDFPHHIQVCAGKNNQERIIKCSEILKGSLRFGASTQSLDKEVLKNVKRSNISLEKLIEVSKQVNDTPASTYSEVILALPGDSKKKHINSIDGLIEAELNQLRLLTLLVLEGSELATDDQRNKFKMKTRYRAVHRSFGIYEFNKKKLPSVEIEEVCVENSSLTFEEYIECRCFGLTATVFYNDRVFFELTQFIKNKGYKITDWLHFIHANMESFPEKLKEIYRQFSKETIEELSKSKDELENKIKTRPGYIESYIKGERGNNVMFNTQARAHLEAMDELHTVAFDCAAELTKIDLLPEDSLEKIYLKELKTYSLTKRQKFTDVESNLIKNFEFDFVALEAENFATLPTKQSSCSINFFYEKWQKEFFVDNIKRQGDTIQALGKIFSRIPIKKLQRTVSRESEM